MMHNYALSGYLTGKRSAAEYSFFQNLEFTWTTIAQSFRGEMVLVVLTIAFALLVGIRRKKQRKLAVLLLLFALLPVAQVLFQNIASSLVHIDQISERYFVVITPVVFINAIIICSVWEPSRRWPLFAAAAFALAVNAVLGHTYHPVANLDEAAKYPIVLVLPLGRYFKFVGAMHSLGYGLRRIEDVLILEKIQ